MLFEHGCELENTLNDPCIIYITLYTESATMFFRENVAYRYDVVAML